MAVRVAVGETETEIGTVEVRASAGNLNPLSLQFWQIAEHFGMPCGVAPVLSGNNVLALVYPSFTVEVRAGGDSFTLNSPVSAIMVSSDSNLDIKNRSCSDKSGLLPWRGFGSMQIYRDIQQINPPYYSYP